MYCFVVLENYILFKTLNLRFFFSLLTAFSQFFHPFDFRDKNDCLCM